MDYTKVMLAIIDLIGIIIATVMVPWMKSKFTNEQLSNFQAWVRIGVAAAEQLFTKEEREEKKQYVVDFLNSKGVRFNEDEIDKAIEAEVLHLHNALESAA